MRFYAVNKFAVLMTIILLNILVSCSEPPKAVPAYSDSGSAASAEDLPPAPTEPSLPENAPLAEPTAIVRPELPLYLPLPYYYAFNSLTAEEKTWETELDSFLHNTAVNDYSTRVTAKEGHLLLPSLRLLSSWDSNDGAKYYLCLMATYDFYNLSPWLKENADIPFKNPYDVGSITGKVGGILVRYKVAEFDPNEKTSYHAYDFGRFQCLEILEQPPYGDDNESIRDMCSNNPELCQQLINANNAPGGDMESVPYIRDILPNAHDKAQLLEQYLNYFCFANSD